MSLDERTRELLVARLREAAGLLMNSRRPAEMVASLAVYRAARELEALR